MRYLLILLSLALISCAKNESSNTNMNKGLFSKWVKTDGSKTHDFTGGELNKTFIYQITDTNTGAICRSYILFTGSEQSGSIAVSSSIYVGGSALPVDCSSLNGSYTFVKSGNSLNLTNSSAVISTYL